MSRNVFFQIAAALLIATGNLIAVEADIDGATPGKWTMDLDAAKKVAAEKQLPILLDFSGSDWCGWCKLMEDSVFTQSEWMGYATNALMMVLIDFPNDKSLVPDMYVERNKALSEAYGIEGFPTFVVIDDDGKTELGRLGAGRDVTPESFKAELQMLFRSRPAEIAKYTASLSPDDQAVFSDLNTKLANAKREQQKQKQLIAEASDQVLELNASINQLEDEVRMFRVKQMGEEKLKEYEALKVEHEAAKSKLEEWLKTDPERNEENMALFQEMIGAVQELETKMSKF